ncbi:MAG: HD domain-containing protein [Spirochaetales bacterium]|nr:HD domain-containing protein [Spirochaetales bacterium]
MERLTERLTIPIEHIKAGMVFSSGLYIDEQNLLVPPRKPVKEKDIKRAHFWGLTHLYTNNGLQGLVKDEQEKNDPTLEYHPAPNEKKVQENYHMLLRRMDLLINQAIEKKPLESSRIQSLATDLLSQMTANGQEMIRLVHWGKSDCSRLAKKLINSAVLAAAIGTKMKMPNHTLMNLILSALLYDIGMIKIDARICNKKDKLSDSEFSNIQKHLLYSYQFIKQMDFSEEIAQAVLYHHENWDGSGYPKKIQAAQIPLLSQILAIVDSYTAMIHKRIYGTPLSGYKALKNIISDNGQRFSPELVSTLLKIIGVYPLGSLVKLNNSSICMVLELNEKALMRPRLTILKTYHHVNTGKSKILDLSKEKGLYITSVIEPELLPQLEYVS